MKKLAGYIKAEHIKLKATPFFLIHFLLPVGYAAMFVIYYSFAGWNNETKISAFYTVLGIAYPIIISLITALVTEQEYNAGNYQNLLAVKNRKDIFFTKALIMIFNGIFALMLASILFGIGNRIILNVSSVGFSFYIYAGLMICAESIILYLLHFLISFRFGRNISILLGIAEGLLSALFRTGLGDGKWQYLPCTWGTRWVYNYLLALTQDFSMENACKTAQIVCIVISFLAIIGFGKWCQTWEGRHVSE